MSGTVKSCGDVSLFPGASSQASDDDQALRTCARNATVHYAPFRNCCHTVTAIRYWSGRERETVGALSPGSLLRPGVAGADPFEHRKAESIADQTIDRGTARAL